ncbi:hypothetical protein PQJ75_03885 [Rhodoplanes sp. TEM]|uniref:Uncharacterized protein n=1 Tax=Rhodoplanes tepidamans TaxID=200616 RepID=A0ABT5J962_RHOTP|nr:MULTISPECIES: hypothetical protein [Rhodoplanes]MDC7786190.1 hypothetical protein [Rhodoplanes tepidamans]MDC7982857.1 hypothetical protein [Rhodoplanes sp. TEM]MDQ0357144.1 hypothetical protein [Rhodoplanes tepidamans]
MTTPVSSLSVVKSLEAAAGHAETAEREYRREAAQRIAALEQERAFAYRRLNLVRELAEAMAGADAEESAVGIAFAMLRGKLGWSQDSEARSEVIERFATFAQALFRSLTSEDEPEPSAPAALAEFENWYVENRHAPFWILFEHYIPETPLVDF